MGVLILVADLLVGVLARGAEDACCRELLPLALECLNVEGEFDRVDTGLPWLEVSPILLTNRGSREVCDAGETGGIGDSVSCLVVPGSGRSRASFDPERSL